VISLLDALARPFLGLLDPEDAHRLAIRALGIPPYVKRVRDDPRLAVRACDLHFPNPIGVAAGFDKHAEVWDALLRLGFGFVEVGTVTLRPQPGNPRPRVFRLAHDEGVINRLGFNSAGADIALRRLAAHTRSGGVVGINIGANKDSTDRSSDYVRLIEMFAPSVSYFCVNISSPNTPGLRDLQRGRALEELLAAVTGARMRAAERSLAPPVLVKIAPDLTLPDLDDLVEAARKHRVDGMIVANTTLARPRSLRDRDGAKQQGGLSGRPLFALSTRMLAETYVRVEGAFPLIGVGGIDSGEAAVAKIRAGALLIQLYTAFIFHGLRLLPTIKAELSRAVARAGCDSIAALVGTDAAALTAQSWPQQ
jgi:dihydroorotate dehydrogenase